MHELEHLYSTCACSSHLPDLSETDDLIAAMMAEANSIWKNNGLAPGTINAKVVKGIANKLWSGVEQGYGISPGVQFGKEDLDMIAHLKKDVYMFSAGKDYALRRQIQDLMLDQNGKLRSKSEFIASALKVSNTSLKSHLATEYDTAIASATMARKWVDIEATKGLFPFLQFDAVLDAQSSKTCPPLDGLIYPVDHEFWDQYYPPNHYNCRSTVRKLTTGPSNPAMKNADIPDQFRTNSAKSKEVFPKEHPYKKNTPEAVKNKARALMPYEDQFDVIQKFDSGGVIKQHFDYKKTEDYLSVNRVAKIYAQEGHVVDINPIISKVDVISRSIVYHDLDNFTNPDLRISGLLADVKNARVTNRSLKAAIENGIEQSAFIIIELKTDLIDTINLNSIVKLKKKDYPKLKEVHFVLPNDEIIKIKAE